MLTIWNAILQLLAGLVSIWNKSVNHDRDYGEKTGVAETEAATAQAAVKEASRAQQIDADVHRLTDDALDAELRSATRNDQ